MVELSVITVVKNHSSGLSATYFSLLKQLVINWEMIIIVGESFDETFEVGCELEKQGSRVRLIQQKSNGIYEAMNEGLACAKGKFAWFMNAGDQFYCPNVIEIALTEISQRGTGLLIGGYCVDYEHHRRVFPNVNRKLGSIRFAFNRRGGCHQAMIFKTDILRQLGGFNLSYLLASDFDIALRIMRISKAARIKDVLTLIEPGGIATLNLAQVLKEKHEIRTRTFNNDLIRILSQLWTLAAKAKMSTRKFKIFKA